jgi:hypothetical protein
MALTLADVVRGRLDLGTAGPPSPGDLEAVQGIAAALLGWDQERRRVERAVVDRAYADPLLE